MNTSYAVLEKAFQNQKITKDFGISEETVFSNFSCLLNSVMDKNEDTSKEAQCLLSRLSIINQESFIRVTIAIIDKNIKEFINKIPVLIKNKSIYSQKEYDETDFWNFYENLFKRVNEIRIGDSFPSDLGISKSQAESYFSYIIDIIQSGESRFSSLESKMNIFTLYVANNLVKISGINRYQFFKLCNLAVELTIHSGDTQLARNNTEEITRLARTEDNQIFAFFIKGNCFLTQKNLNDALLYFSVILNNADESLPFDFWESVFVKIEILYRELHFPELENNYFNRITHYLSNFSLRIKDNFYMSHFASKFQQKLDVSSDILIYLSDNREEIYKLGTDAFKVWYVFLYQVYSKSKNEGLLIYINNFYKCLPIPIQEKLDIMLGIHTDYKTVLNKIFDKIIKTKFNDDRNSEIRMSILIINKYIDKSISDNNIELFINTFRLKTGLQFIAPEDYEEGDVKVSLSEVPTLPNYFDSFIQNFHTSQLLKSYNLLLCAKTDQNYYSLFIGKKINKFILLKFSSSDINQIVNTLPETMFFDPAEDAEVQKQRLKKQEKLHSKLLFEIPDITKPLIIIYDNSLCSIPSNVIEMNQPFFELKTKVLSVTSLDFLIQCKNIEIKNDISLWCPLDNGDIPLNFAFSGVKDFLKQNEIIYETKMIPEKTLLSDISIIIAHGGKDIAHKQYFMANGTFGNEDMYYTDITKCIPKPKLVILFICHSGKTTKNMLYESSKSLQDLLFRNGAYAVIAPEWPLHSSIPGVWLPKFIDALKDGKNSFEAFSEAQDYVLEIYPNAGAWACLHYFGNPDIRIDKEEKK